MSTLKAVDPERKRARWPWGEVRKRTKTIILEYRDRYNTISGLASALGIGRETIRGMMKGHSVAPEKLYEVWVSGPPSCAIIAGEIIQRIYP